VTPEALSPAVPSVRAGRRTLRLARARFALRWLALTAGGLLFASVFAYAVLSALKPPGEVLSGRLFPSHWLLSNFKLPFEQAPFARYYLNSVVVGASVTLLNVFTCTLAGYSFSKFDYRGRNVLFFVVLATLMIPLEVIYVPLYALVYDLGWVNSFLGLIIPSGTSAFGIFLMRQSIDAVPDELLDAARIDGAGEVRILRSVVVPIVRSPMAALALFIFMANWDSHLWPLLVASDDAHRTLPVGLAAMQANNLGAGGVPTMMAAAVLALLPTLVLFLALQRRFVEGITMTAGIK
jgi:ABC-type glycerol-3-phosphate transport system permease component